MRVAMVSQSYYPALGGVTEHVHSLWLALRKLGCDVTIITAGPQRESENGVIRIGINVPFPINGAIVNVTLGLRLAARIQSIINRLNSDIIHIHSPLEPTLPLAALMASHNLRQPVIGTFHMSARISPAYEVFGTMLRRYARRINVRIAVSQAAKFFARRYFPGSYRVVPNGVDCMRFSNGNLRIREFDDHKINFLFVGRFDPRKQVRTLIRAFKRLASKRDDCRLILVGKGITYPCCLAEAGCLAGKNVIFVGKVPPSKLPAYYRSADVFCSIPKGSESFGIVLLEAMAAGKPVIASDIDGYREIITNGSEGILVDPKDIDEIANAMTVLADDVDMRKQMGIRGLRRAKEFDWQRIAMEVFKIYRQVLSAPTFRGRNGSRTISGVAIA